MPGGFHGLRDLPGLISGAAACATTLDPHLEQDLQSAARARVVEGRIEQLHGGDRVDQAVEVETGIAAKLAGDPADRLRLHELVREHDSGSAERPPHAD